MFTIFTPVIDVLIAFAVIGPVIGVAAKKVSPKAAGFLGVYNAVAFLLAAIGLYHLYAQVSASNVVVVPVAVLPGAVLVIDMLSVFMAAVFLMLGFVASIYSIRYMERDTGLPEYYALLLAMVAGMIGVVFAGDFFTLFLFWELMCISSYVLVAFRKGEWEAVEAGFKYLIMSATGSALIIFAIALLYGMTGTVTLGAISSSLAGVQAASQVKLWIYLTLAVVIIGFGIKASIVPLHTWLPDAHPAAPSPISALLSGVVIQTGVYAIIRFLYLIFQPAPISWPVVLTVLSIVAVLTMTTGNVMALLQKDIKRLLAFSSIAHVGYILLAISVGTVFGLSAGLLHIMNHAIMKGLLFLCAGVFVHAVGTRNIESLAGIGHRMNVTAVILTIGALAISGIPPLNGFISEFLIVLATLDANMLALTIILLINILIGFAYYLRLLYVLVWKAPGKNLDKVKEAPLSMLAPMMLLAVLCIVIGVWPSPFIEFANQAAQATMNVLSYVTAI